MGFYSANCEGCGHPLLSIAATEGINRWMNLGVAITRGGSILKGSYDGYGRLDHFDDVIGDTTVWHQACWHVAGAPLDYRGRRRRQGIRGGSSPTAITISRSRAAPRCDAR